MAVDFLSIKKLLHWAVQSPESVSIEELDEVITWLLTIERRHSRFAEAARQINRLRGHLLAGEFKQAKSAARRAIDFLG